MNRLSGRKRAKDRITSVMKRVEYGNGYFGFEEIDNLERLLWEAGKLKGTVAKGKTVYIPDRDMLYYIDSLDWNYTHGQSVSVILKFRDKK